MLDIMGDSVAADLKTFNEWMEKIKTTINEGKNQEK